MQRACSAPRNPHLEASMAAEKPQKASSPPEAPHKGCPPHRTSRQSSPTALPLPAEGACFPPVLGQCPLGVLVALERPAFLPPGSRPTAQCQGKTQSHHLVPRTQGACGTAASAPWWPRPSWPHPHAHLSPGKFQEAPCRPPRASPAASA